MKNLLLIVCSFSLLFGCATTDVDSDAKQQPEKPASIRVGMAESEVLSILGKPQTKNFVTLENGKVVETWKYRHLVREWQQIQDTDFETVEKVNLITGELEEEVLPIESTVTRSIFQEIIIKINNGQVIGLDSRIDEDFEDVLD